MNKYSVRLNPLFSAIFAGLLLAAPLAAHATSCKEILDGGSYRNSGGFTRGPATVGCYLGQALGGLLGAPVALVYVPVRGACETGDAACKDVASPIEDGGALVGNSLSHLIGFPFFALESMFTGWGDAASNEKNSL